MSVLVGAAAGAAAQRLTPSGGGGEDLPAGVTLSGEQQRYHPIRMNLVGPSNSGEVAATFSNFRIDVTFTQAGEDPITVPAYYAADGNAAETGATSGTTWSVIFRPPTSGQWDFSISSRAGTNIATLLPGNNGSSSPSTLDAASGHFQVAESDKFGRDFRAPTKGWLVKDGSKLRYQGSSVRYHLVGGTGSPENILGFHQFDGTTDLGNFSPPTGSGLHEFAGHATSHYNGDGQLWQTTKGAGLYGAINYLTDVVGANACYIILDNAGDNGSTLLGDGRDTYPWPNAAVGAPRTIYDVSKLEQWQRVVEHMRRKGMTPTFFCMEQENQQLLDGSGTFGNVNKVLIREMIARLGGPAIWGASEEPTEAQIASFWIPFIDHFAALAPPWLRLIGNHNNVGQEEQFANYSGAFNTVIHQCAWDTPDTSVGIIAYDIAATYTQTPHNWVYIDSEQGWAWETTDALQAGNAEHTWFRRIQFASLFGGGSGIQIYKQFGPSAPNDLTMEDFTTYEDADLQLMRLLQFFRDFVPFHQCTPHSGVSGPSTVVTTGGASNTAHTRCCRKVGECYVVYQPLTGSVTINMTGESGTWRQDRYNPVWSSNLPFLANVTTNLDISNLSAVPLGNPGAEMVTIVTKVLTPSIRWIELIDADTGFDIGELYEGCTIDVAALGANLAFKAVTSPGVVGRVVFSGNVGTGTDTVAPYALPGDASGVYSPWQSGAPANGSYSITATPFTAAAGGTEGTPLTINFSVVNGEVGGGELLQFGGETVEYGGEQVSY